MEKNSLQSMVNGWFVGDFLPTCLKTNLFEAACKYYKSGDFENRHVHRIATEITVIARGAVKMNNNQYKEGDIIIIEPGVSTDFLALEDTITMVIKVPSGIGDKYIE